ncbi:MAG: anaerobic glycerol-3-phosphate dehydrogenase subunit GlpB [Candidatus Cryptobacteroides sp.]
MKFDSIIIGGGLSGLVAGIGLQKKGMNCLVVSAGQSALHFFSGSFELYNTDKPYAEALAGLDPCHPYSKLGVGKVLSLAAEVPAFFQEAGINLSGEGIRNHFRITPMGVLKPAWLTLEGYASVPSDGKMPWKKVAIANIDGFLDFHPGFLAAGLSAKGVESRVCTVSMPELDHLRTNPTEMRSTNIARTLSGNLIGELASRLSEAAEGCDAVLVPAVLGLNDPVAAQSLKARTAVPVEYVATLPPSVPGIRTQLMLRACFQKLGGTYILGDSVISGEFESDRLKGIRTVNHGDTFFEADNFVLASGSFFSRGVMALIDGVFEPVFGLDVDSIEARPEWYKANMFDSQPYMGFGVRTDSSLRVSRQGGTMQNLLACGSVLSGFNGIKEGCGAGVSILTALAVVDFVSRQAQAK